MQPLDDAPMRPLVDHFMKKVKDSRKGALLS
jgi:hypothetical protein